MAADFCCYRPVRPQQRCEDHDGKENEINHHHAVTVASAYPNAMKLGKGDEKNQAESG